MNRLKKRGFDKWSSSELVMLGWRFYARPMGGAEFLLVQLENC